MSHRILDLTWLARCCAFGAGVLLLGCDAQVGPDWSPSPALDGVAVERVSRWKGDGTAAYTISHDDACEPTTSGLFDFADPELRQRGLKAAFGAIVVSCVNFDRWTALNGLLEGGHEIMNHTWAHKNLVTETRDFTQQVQVAKATLDSRLSVPTEFFIFPYDSFDDAALTAVKESGHIGARAGSRGVNDADVDELAVSFDVYGLEYSIYATDPVKSRNILDALVDDAIAKGGWALRELHGVEDESWQAVPLADYRRHLDYLASLVQARALWVAGPTEVIRYRRAVRACGSPTVSRGSLSFPNAGTECAAAGSGLSVVLRAKGLARMRARQGEVELPVTSLAPDLFLVDVAPLGGAVELSSD